MIRLVDRCRQYAKNKCWVHVLWCNGIDVLGLFGLIDIFFKRKSLELFLCSWVDTFLIETKIAYKNSNFSSDFLSELLLLLFCLNKNLLSLFLKLVLLCI